MVLQREKALKEVGDKVSDSDRANVQADVDALKEALKNTPADGSMTEDQLNNIKSLKEKLMSSSQAVFTKMYEQAQASSQNASNAGAQAGPDMNAGGAAHNDDNVVDGDYKEV